MKLIWLIVLSAFTALAQSPTIGRPLDAAPFGLPESNGIKWEDPREIHRVVVTFKADAPAADRLRLEYWGSRWPEQHLPKDKEPGGGFIGWWEMGNWYNGGWRIADTECSVTNKTAVFTFHPLNAKEFPNLSYTDTFRWTLKIRVASDAKLPEIEKIQAFTDSKVEPRIAKLAWQKEQKKVEAQAFNGAVEAVEKLSPKLWLARFQSAINSDPNTFDRTLITIRSGTNAFTFCFDDLANGPLYLPSFGVAVLPENDNRDFAAIAAAQKASGAKTLYDRVAEMAEQTWRRAWAGMPPKKSHIVVPLGLDGGRQRFRCDADGPFFFRTSDGYLTKRPGKETPRFALEAGAVHVSFVPQAAPVERSIEEASLPICTTVWENGGVRITQTAFATELGGTKADGPPPPGDAFAVLMAKLVLTNISTSPQAAALPFMYGPADFKEPLRASENGWLRLGQNWRAQIVADTAPREENGKWTWSWILAPGETKAVFVKLPYVVLTNDAERAALEKLDFDTEHSAVAAYWRRRLDESARLITPEPTLNEFYRAHAGHLLVNCEQDSESQERRFARVGSFVYGAYGNESCMMVVDLDRRGLHREAQQCLDGWLHYQGTAALPGDFSTKEGVLYGCGGVEEGGYNQHHGWILWCLAEHYRFTRDEAWLHRSAPGVVKACDWIINETKRTGAYHPLERGLLPAGSLEDIGDWWTWLSTSCYTWRGLDSAAWALEQIKHPDAKRIRAEADAYHAALLKNFHEASVRSPVVRLRDGTAVPKIPSTVHRRGRYFGWICETLEGALHLVITRAIDAKSPEALAIIKDYEDNLYLSNQYGYALDDFDKHWFGRGGMSMQSCLFLDVEPYLYRDDVKHALRATFNAIAAGYFPDERMITEHALPELGDWRGDHYKSSDEANACGWLRQLFVREEGDQLLIGQAIPREWLKPGQTCGIQRAATYFGKVSVVYTASEDKIVAQLDGPTRTPADMIHVRFRVPDGRRIQSAFVNGRRVVPEDDWVVLRGNIGRATVTVELAAVK